MQVDFKTATKYFSGDEFITSSTSPFDGVELSPFLSKLISDLRTFQARRDIGIDSGFLFGGAAPDLAMGLVPQDYDVYIQSPDWVNRVKIFWALREHACGFKEARELDESRESMIFGYGCPVSPSTEIYKVFCSEPFGDYIEYKGAYCTDEGVYDIDLKIGSKPTTPIDLLPYTSAPIMGLGVALKSNSEAQYVYHRDYPNHVRNKLLVTARADHPDLIEKAQRKGLQIRTLESV